MCGICGWYDLRGATDSVYLSRMVNRLMHRGPTEGGVFEEGPLHIGMRRLSIIDLAGGKQPMRSICGRYALVFNGQIYNYVEMRLDLEGRGREFRTRSDTEVLLTALMEWGADALSRLNGMFAFAFWDASEQTLLLARDRLGVKPLYVMADSNRVAFASELKALMVLPNFDKSISANALGQYLHLGYPRAPQTMFERVKSVQPGTWVRVDDSGHVTERRWWAPAVQVDPSLSMAKATDTLFDLLDDAVRIRMRSDVPVGVCLSGGIDSSAVAGLMARHSAGEQIRSFTVGFGADGEVDSAFADLVARHFGTVHRQITISPENAIAELPELTWFLDEPHGDSAILPSYRVFKIAASELRVVLTGVGGDELFGGYSRYFDGTRLEHLYRTLPQSARGLLAPVLGRVNPVWGWRATMNSLPMPERYIWHGAVFAGALKTQLLPKGPECSADFLGTRVSASDDPNEAMCLDLGVYLPNSVLHVTDRASMAVSIEAREPILDHRLVEFSLKLRTQAKVDWLTRQTKICFKKSMQGFLPDPVLKRKKLGFGSPVEIWMRGHLGALTTDLLRNGSLVARGIVDKSGLQDYLQNGHGYDPVNRGVRLWTLLMLELWVRVFLDDDGSRPAWSLYEASNASAKRTSEHERFPG